jgi:hypothetical protein
MDDEPTTPSVAQCLRSLRWQRVYNRLCYLSPESQAAVFPFEDAFDVELRHLIEAQQEKPGEQH